MTANKVIDIDLLQPALYHRGVPHGLYAELRRRGPVLWHPRTHDTASDADIEFWAVIGHPEVQQVSRDAHTFSSCDGSTIVPFPPEQRGRMIVTKDPPEHTRMRRLVHAAFTPRMIARLEVQIAEWTERILDRAEGRDELDFVADIAYELPMQVIADIVGIPEAERPEVFRITEIMVRSWDPQYGFTREHRDAAQKALFDRARALNRAKRAHPTDDVWSILANSELEESELELFLLVLAAAGSETTRNALTQGMMALLDHPDQLQDLRNDATLLPTAVEEILRWSSPVICFARTATRDVELGDQAVRAGERVALFYPSANRDERVFTEPDCFDIRRSPNPHVAFGGGGAHLCLGASLARMEIQVMFGQLLRRFSTIEISGPAKWFSAGPANTVGVAVQSLPIRLRPIHAEQKSR
jgi:cytochrome P450